MQKTGLGREMKRNPTAMGGNGGFWCRPALGPVGFDHGANNQGGCGGGPGRSGRRRPQLRGGGSLKRESSEGRAGDPQKIAKNGGLGLRGLGGGGGGRRGGGECFLTFGFLFFATHMDRSRRVGFRSAGERNVERPHRHGAAGGANPLPSTCSPEPWRLQAAAGALELPGALGNEHTEPALQAIGMLQPEERLIGRGGFK